MKTLSVILSFYDRDEGLIDPLAERIRELAKDVHDYNIEFLIVDDRKSKSKKLKSSEFIVEPYRGNKGLLYSRWWGFTHSHGDFIWFIDADDEILEFPKFDENQKMSVFNYYDHDSVNFEDESRFITKHEVMTIRNLRKWLKVGTWNKVYRRDLVEEVYADYGIADNKKKFEHFFVFEDSVFNFTCLKHIEGFDFVNQKIYKWLWKPCSRYLKEDIIRAIKTVPSGFRRNAYVKLIRWQGYFVNINITDEELLDD